MNEQARLSLLALVVAGFLSFLTGCGGGSLRLTPIKATQQKPSNVAVYFKVQAGNGDPIGGLTADQFRIYEDGALVSENESKQTILNPEVAASHYTLLLVDMSGSVTGDAEAVGTLVDAATAFTERVEKSQKVAVYAFDGGEDLHPIASFTTAGGAKGAVKGLGSYKPQDPSTNLNGAVIKGLEELDKALAHAEHPMRFGTLVVFSDGTDRAGRVKKEDMRKAVRDSKYEIFAIGLGKELQESELKDVGKDGTARADDKQQVVKAFDTIAERIENSTKAYYLLSYCSPSRAGKHEVKIEAVIKDAEVKDGKEGAKGGGERTGSLRSEFDATGFGPGCDPNTPPNFDLSKGDALAPKEDEKKDKDEKSDKADKDKDRDKDRKENKKGDEKKPSQTSSQNKPAAKPVQLPPPPPPEEKKQQDFNP